MSGLWIEAGRRVPRSGRRGTEYGGGRRVGSRGACKLGVGRVLRREGRKGITLLALPDASLAKKLWRDLEALEFLDGGHVGKRVDRAMGVVGGWNKMTRNVSDQEKINEAPRFFFFARSTKWEIRAYLSATCEADHEGGDHPKPRGGSERNTSA